MMIIICIEFQNFPAVKGVKIHHTKVKCIRWKSLLLFLKFSYSQQYPDAEFWKTDAQSRLQAKLEKNPIEARAKNVIFYLGDGMSGRQFYMKSNALQASAFPSFYQSSTAVQTVTAARIMKGQKVDNLPFGEEAELHMDSFPYTGTSKV